MVPMISDRLRVCVCDAAGRPLRAHGLGPWLSQVAPASARGLVTIAIVSDARVRALNREYRRVDRATDVLSFPAQAARTESRGRRTRTDPASGSASRVHVLGDIIIASGVSRRQARAERHGYAMELRVLALHGLLHLLGYDHARDGGRMRRLEGRLRRKGGLALGLIERVGAARDAAKPSRPGANRRARKK